MLRILRKIFRIKPKTMLCHFCGNECDAENVSVIEYDYMYPYIYSSSFGVISTKAGSYSKNICLECRREENINYDKVYLYEHCTKFYRNGIEIEI